MFLIYSKWISSPVEIQNSEFTKKNTVQKKQFCSDLRKGIQAKDIKYVIHDILKQFPNGTLELERCFVRWRSYR